ncbi:hypothetical protein LOD99_14099 [Oopsacas minuta]|uniref:Peptidase M20 domain-containing protein 2 n=1 Tax=Oopsacas minuta TaxID=111878 RepID=A0AAV7KHZ8_9METZ|nr:hypothetical protein LOD99_14099 [Oopsacas minuta]
MMEEVKAHAILTDFLQAEGFKVERSYILPTAFKAIYYTQSDEPDVNACVICEYDALPGVEHGCGHNLIAEAGLAAAIGIKAVIEIFPDVKLKLTVMGTPGEEGGGGKIKMLSKEAFKGIDFAIMVHPANFNAIYPNVLSLNGMEITYTGKPAHAAAYPWEGVNALDAAVNAYSAVSMMRQQFKPTWRAHGVFTDGGLKPNVIPDRAVLSYMIRAPNNAELEQLMDKLEGCFNAGATATGCTVVINKSDIPYFDMRTNSILAEIYRNNSMELGMTYPDIETDKAQSSFSTDMGNVSYEVPSIHPTYALNTTSVNHTTEFNLASNTIESHEITLIAGIAMAHTAIDVVFTDGVLIQVKEEFYKNK